MKKVSVIIPTFNRAGFLKNTVGSVLKQGYENIEIIIADDRSTDNTVEVVNEIRNEHPKIIYCRNSGVKGPSGARNTGLTRATGDYITFLDSDDVWLEGHLNKGLAILESYSRVDVIFSNYRVVEFPSGAFLFNFFDKKKILFTLPTVSLNDDVRLITGNLFEALIQENFFNLGGCIVSRPAVKGVFFDERVTFAEDADFAIQMFKKNKACFAYRMEPVFVLYRHGGNLTETCLKNGDNSFQDAHILLFTEYLSKYAEGPRQKALLKEKISENMLGRSYIMRLKGNYLTAFRDMAGSSRYKLTPAHFIYLVKLCGAALLRHSH
jgi:glycosyltransferase involved in cell wall biosynthesis